MTRHESREQVFMVLFEKIFDKDSTVTEIVERAEESELIKINTFAKSLLTLFEENFEAIDEIISSNTVGWTLERLPKVSLAILRLAVCELKFNDDIPDSVAISEAVEIAKKYGTDADASYINGVLGTISRA